MLYLSSFILALVLAVSGDPPKFKNFGGAYSPVAAGINSSVCAMVNDFRNPFTPCDSVFEGLSGANVTTATYLFLRNSLLGGVDLYTVLDQLCSTAKAYSDCIIATNNICQNNPSVQKMVQRNNLANPFMNMLRPGSICNGDGTLNSVANAMRKSKEFSNCLSGNTLNRLLVAFDSLFAAVQQASPIYDQTSPPGMPGQDNIPPPTAAQNNSLVSVCNKFIDFKKQLPIVLSQCSTPVVKVIQFFANFIMPPDINSRCTIPTDAPGITFKNSDSRRITVVIFGGFNKINISATTVETCTYNDGVNVSLLVLPQLAFTCTIHLLSPNSTYGYFNQCEIVFWDSNQNVIDTLEFTGVKPFLPTAFSINGGQKLTSASGKGNGKATNNIILSSIDANTVRINDANSGLVIYVNIFSSAVSGANIYSVVLRMSADAFNQVPNEFSYSCVSPIVLPNSGSSTGRRRKRDASTVSTTSAGQYDASSNNDPSAASMATAAQANAGAAASQDTAMSQLISGGSGSSWKEPLMKLVGLSTMLVFLVIH